MALDWLEVNMSNIKRGSGYWRFNNYWLTDKEFIGKIRAQIHTAKNQDMTNPNMKWEWVKHKIRVLHCLHHPTLQGTESMDSKVGKGTCG